MSGSHPLNIRVQRITFFVDDLEATTAYYRDTLGLPAADVREGWSAFRASKDTEIAFHKGTGRRPRIELVVKGDLREARAALNARGARLGECKKMRGRDVCVGKDKDGNSVQLSADDVRLGRPSLRPAAGACARPSPARRRAPRAAPSPPRTAVPRAAARAAVPKTRSRRAGPASAVPSG